jgi:nucleoside phosphorylase
LIYPVKNRSAEFILHQLKSENLPLLFITAHHQEARPLLVRFPGMKKKTESYFRLYGHTDFPLNLLQTGPALQHKTDRLADILIERRPSLVINFGICGALDDHIPLYKAFSAAAVHLSGGDKRLVIQPPDTFPRILMNKFPPAELLTVLRPVLKSEEKENLRKSYDSQLVDMEGYFIVRTAQQLSTPCIVLKLVSDRADEQAFSLIKSNIKQWQNHISDMLDYLLGIL